ncbi:MULTISPECIES: STAS domain-containing protein [Isoptericola]|uniref:Anti-sigma factor antagonist n=1 Tax=Isoptericola sediminis TaxID=2733572 RepID=A0A849K240_9MICO|nr:MULTISPECIES: STAS domain-containing protein [Isoptericola]MDO8143671.1 STAS domain-containing protein [Isoptericola sp. 178]MDO8147568.1 STAS domain-containing protein [Isoptericola sp. b515]MDO8150130.1 STAS domain-containing protein [Isoptericola sp. b408]NNU27268.1 STAS domain-containing protein [Isoptericola sediminis]
MDYDSATDMDPDAGSGISCQHDEGGTLLMLWGEVDAALRESASDAMASVAARPGAEPIVLDTRDVTFIDSSGVAFILQVYMFGEEVGAPVQLRSPSEAVTEVLEMVGMDGRIPVIAEERATSA